MTTILGVITGIAGIIGGVVWIFKRIDWSVTKTQAQKDAEIDKANQDAKHQAEDSGRPA